MDFLELAKNRFSLRKFSDKKVEKEKIDYILAAMQAAPTAVNFQPQRILAEMTDTTRAKSTRLSLQRI